MNFLYTKRFKELYINLPLFIRKKFSKQLELMTKNMRHPSLGVKKIQGYPDVWEARVDYQYRFTFNWEKDNISFRVIGMHDDTLKNP